MEALARLYADVDAEAGKVAGMRLWVATTKPQPYALRLLEHFGLLPHFAGVYGAELNGDRAEKGDLIAYLLASEGIPAEHAMMVGDRGQDIRGARQNGLRAIGVLWGYGCRAELEESRPDAFAESPDRLPATVARLLSQDSPSCPQRTDNRHQPFKA